MSHSGYHPPEEEYLSTIRDLEEDGVDVIQARLAERLGYTAPAVSEMVRKLAKDGLIEVDGRSIRLSEAGRAKADSVVRRHRLAERLLTDILGLDWYLVHEEAAKWEHVISDAVEERILAVLGNPETCPHGNPIPGYGRDRDDLVRLADTGPGSDVTIERLTESIEVRFDLMKFLGEYRVQPGVDVHVSAVAPDGTVTLDVGGRTVAVGSEISDNLYVSLR